MPFGQGDRAVVESFAAQLGLPSRPARDGSFSFVFNGADTLTFTPSSNDHGCVMSLAWAPGRLDAGVLRRHLQSGGYDPATGLVFHAGLSPRGAMLYAVRFDENEISLPVVETCMQDLFARRAQHVG